MREILVISGKGGTGKTTVTGAFAHLARQSVICDLDVDAPDLHLLLTPRNEYQESFVSGFEATIDADVCVSCGECAAVCRFEAVQQKDGGYWIDPMRCEGCKVCVERCPEEAVRFEERECGNWYLSSSRFGPMVHAQLYPGQENSGRLVTLLKQQARKLAESAEYELILCDGSPGIGCPVISSLSGVDLAVAVTEPTPSGLHDLERLAALCDHFRIPLTVMINKYDLNVEQVRAIEDFCAKRDAPIIGRLPHDPSVTRAMIEGKTVTEYAEGGLGRDLAHAWEKVTALASA